MVWFQCEDCGENLKKPKLPGHFRQCSATKLSCIDCGLVFSQQSVQGHTQCISEAEKYGPKGVGKVANGTPAKLGRRTGTKNYGLNKPERLRGGERERKRARESMGIDLTNWDEELYRQTILQERENQCRTVFRAIFAPNPNPSPSPSPDIVVAASSDGSIASYSISSCLASLHSTSQLLQVAEPLCFLRAHDGPAYDVKFYDNAENSMLLSCGDDGRILGWKWSEMTTLQSQGLDLEPVLELMNPQHKGPWGALSPIPENNAIAIDNEAGSVYAAAGDSCAYCWDLETSKIKTIFKGHTDYVHSVATRKSYNQIITCSEDGTARMWDSRNGKCVQVISPKRDKQRKGTSCITSLALDLSENWLAFGSGQSLYVWNLLVQEQILRISTHMSTQDVLFHDNEILAVGAKPVLSRYDMSGKALSQIQCAPQSAFSVSLHPSGVVAVAGYGGLVDVVSQFGSHLCTFGCKSA